jgi:hypothetical protein
VSISQLLHQIASDTQLQTILLLIAADFILGVVAALKMGTFKLSYVANFVRNDVVTKAFGWAVLDAFAIVAGNAHIIIPQFDLTNTAHAVFAGVVLAMVGSIASSLSDLGLDVIPSQLGRGGAARPVDNEAE